MSYRDKPFGARRSQMGDQAEGKFEEVYPKPFVKLGLRRPDEVGVKVQNLPHRIRHLPDFLTNEGLVEVLGCGRDGQVKLGLTKWNCLLFYQSIMPVFLWVWSSTKKKAAMVPLDAVIGLLDQGRVTLGTFVEQKAYLGIAFDDLMGISVEAA